MIDFVGYGTATDHEGAGAAPSPAGTTHSIQREAGGCTETDDNASDFKASVVTPRNSATPVNPCGSVADASVDDSAAADSATTEDSTAPADSSVATGDAVTDSSAKKASVSDLPSASTCSYPIHNPSQGSFALIGVALCLALCRRALR